MEAYNHKIKKFGIEYTMSKDSVMVTGLPACVLEKEATELKRGRQTVASTVAEVRFVIISKSISSHCYAMHCFIFIAGAKKFTVFI